MSVKKAVALSYPEDAAAPFVSASATGIAAGRVIEIARENDVPIVQNDVLVSVLSGQKIGTFVPEETWVILAKIFAFVIENNNKKM